MESSPERWQKISEKQHLQRRIDLLSWIDLLSAGEEAPDADPIDRTNLVAAIAEAFNRGKPSCSRPR
jgi:hypothetical protein